MSAELGRELQEALATLGFTSQEAAECLRVTPGTLRRWLHVGVPVGRHDGVTALCAVADVLSQHLRPERIHSVVRRPAAGLGGLTLVEYAITKGPAETLAIARQMFDFELTT